jgi:hypothetical protein
MEQAEMVDLISRSAWLQIPTTGMFDLSHTSGCLLGDQKIGLPLNKCTL